MRVTEITEGVVEKRLDARHRDEPEAVLALEHEARLLQVLDGHPTPKLLEFGVDARGPFLRMEKVAYATLADRLAAPDELLAPSWIARAMRSSFEALSALHEATSAAGPLGIVHADLGPGNIAVDDSGERATLLDLELACVRGMRARDGTFRGTIAYAAPEVARGELPTVRSDLFSLAATFLHVLTGRPPRTGPSLAAMIVNAAELPLDLAQLARIAHLALPANAHSVLTQCLAHPEDERPPSARAVVARLGLVE